MFFIVYGFVSCLNVCTVRVCMCTVCAVHLPVRWKTSPPAQPGRALAVELGRLWTGSPPAGSPYSPCSPSHTPNTRSQRTHPPTTTHTHSADPQQHEHVVGHHTLKTGRRQNCWRPVCPSSCLSLCLSVSPPGCLLSERLCSPPTSLCLPLCLSSLLLLLLLLLLLPRRYCRCCCWWWWWWHWSRWRSDAVLLCVCMCMCLYEMCVLQMSRFILPLSSPT